MSKITLSQSPYSVNSYKCNNQLVTVGYESTDADYWFRIDGSAPQHFHNRAERDAALEIEFAPARPIRLDPKISAALDAMFSTYVKLINCGKDAYEFYAASAEFAKRQQQAAQTITYCTMIAA